MGGGEARAAAGWQGRETQSQTWGSDWTERQEGVQHRRSAQLSRERLGTGDREGSNRREAGAREDTKADHTSFFIIKKDISLCYGLGMDMVHQDFPFQSIREKEFQKRIKGMANS